MRRIKGDRARGVDGRQRNEEQQLRAVTGAGILAPATHLTLPRLDGIARLHRLKDSDPLAAKACIAFLEAGGADPLDWARAKRSPAAFLQCTLDRWARQACADATDFSVVGSLASKDKFWQLAERKDIGADALYFVVWTDAAKLIAEIGPTLQMLERVDKDLPAAWYSRFAGSLDGFVRAFDYREALDKMEYYTEMEIDQEMGGDMPRPDLCVPPCLLRRRPARSDAWLRKIMNELATERVAQMISDVLELSEAAEGPPPHASIPPEFEDSDWGYPFPAVGIVFDAGDDVAACYDHECEDQWNGGTETGPDFIMRVDITSRRSIEALRSAVTRYSKVLGISSRIIRRLAQSRDGRALADVLAA